MPVKGRTADLQQSRHLVGLVTGRKENAGGPQQIRGEQGLSASAIAALRLGGRQSRDRPLLDEFAFHFSDGGKDVEQETARSSGGVEPVRQGTEVDPPRR